MSNHDQDLITDLISGRLSHEESEAALARLAQDPQLRSEYESQLAVASLLADATGPTMTAQERSTLRASLIQQLNLEDSPAPVPVVAAPSLWQRWWAPAMGLAAAAAVIVGFVVIQPQGNSDDALTFAAADVTTTAASQSAGADGGETAEPDGLNFSDESAATTGSEETTTTAAAAAETTTTAALEAAESQPQAGDFQTRSVPSVLATDLERLAEAYAAGAGEFDDELNKSTSDQLTIDMVTVEECLAVNGDLLEEGAALEVVATTVVAETEAAVIAVTPPGAAPYLVALDLSSCRVLDSMQP